ncbi:MAG: hypothetical protein ACKN89_17210 [Cyanobium sp.]
MASSSQQCDRSMCAIAPVVQAKLLVLGFLALLYSPTAAQAVVVNVGGTSYDITVQATAYASNSTLFDQPPNGRMPWWADVSGASAAAFALEVYDQLGGGPTPGYGPLFAYTASAGSVNAILQNLSDPLSQLDDTYLDTLNLSYAIATPLSTPSAVPAPLPLAACGAALTWSRRLRRRLHSTR